MKEKNIKNRIFVVGCPRSGTTFVQSLLGAHPAILTFPESDFVGNVTGDHMKRAFCIEPETTWTKLRALLVKTRILAGVANRAVLPRFRENMTHLGREDLFAMMPRHPVTISRAIRKWSDALDRAALESGHMAWLEKTPMHYAYIEEISSNIHGSQFIHVVRDALGVVASMKDAARKYPTTGWAHYEKVENAVAVWNRAVSYTRKYAGRHNHHVVSYESVVENPAASLRAACDFLGLEFDESMLENRDKVATSVSLSSEPWKAKVKGEIKKEDKIKACLSEAEIAYVSKHALDVTVLA